MQSIRVKEIPLYIDIITPIANLNPIMCYMNCDGHCDFYGMV